MMSFCPARSLSYQHVQNAPFRSRPPDTLGLQYHSAAATVGLDQLDHPQARIGSELLASHAHAALRLRFFDASLRVRPNPNPKVQDADGMLPRDPTILFGMCFVEICTSLEKVLHCTRPTGVAPILHTSSPSCVRRQMYWNRIH